MVYNNIIFPQMNSDSKYSENLEWRENIIADDVHMFIVNSAHLVCLSYIYSIINHLLLNILSLLSVLSRVLVI